MDYLKEYKRQNELLFDKSFNFLKSHKVAVQYDPDCTREELNLKLSEEPTHKDFGQFFSEIQNNLLFALLDELEGRDQKKVYDEWKKEERPDWIDSIEFKSSKELATIRCFFLENKKYLFDVLSNYLGGDRRSNVSPRTTPLPSEFIEVLREEWEDEKGLWALFSTEDNRKIKDNRAAHVYSQQASQPDLSATTSDDLYNFAGAAVRAHLLFFHPQPSGDVLTNEDKRLDVHLRYSTEAKLLNTTATDIFNLFNSMSWGPDNYVLNQNKLDEYHELLKNQRILILHGIGAIGKTALANKILWDYLARGMKYDGDSTFERYLTFSTKVDSEQGEIDEETGGSQIKKSGEDSKVYSSLLSDATGQSFEERMTGFSHKLWKGIVSQFEPPVSSWSTEDLRSKSIVRLTNERLLLVIDNFEDLQSITQESNGEFLSEYIKIKSWLKEIADKGASLKSRIIITSRAGRGIGEEEVEGYRKKVEKLAIEDAVTLFIDVIQKRLRIAESDEDKRLSSKLRKILPDLRYDKTKKEFQKSFKDWSGEDSAHPIIVISSAHVVEKYDDLESMLKDWKKGNEYTRKIYEYITKKMLDTSEISENQLSFLKSILDLKYRQDGFSSDEITMRNIKLSTPNATQDFINQLRAWGWLHTENHRGSSRYRWVPEISKSLSEQLGIKQQVINEKIESIEDSEGNIPEIESKTQSEPTEWPRNPNVQHWWGEWLDLDPDLSKPHEAKLPWASPNSTNPKYNILYHALSSDATNQIKKSVNDYDKGDLIKTYNLCERTLILFKEFVVSNKQIHLISSISWIEEYLSQLLILYSHCIGNLRSLQNSFTDDNSSISGTPEAKFIEESLEWTKKSRGILRELFTSLSGLDLDSDKLRTALAKSLLIDATSIRTDYNKSSDFSHMLEQIALELRILNDVDFRDNSLVIDVGKKPLFRKWHRLYLSSNNLDIKDTELLSRLRGYMFWVSIRLHLDPNRKEKIKYEEWEDEENRENGFKISKDKLSSVRIQYIIRKASAKNIKKERQISFGRLATQSSLESYIGVSIPVHLEDEEDFAVSRIENGSNSLEIRCKKTQLAFKYPGDYLVRIIGVIGNRQLEGKILFDEEGIPLESHSIPEEVLDGANQFIKSVSSKFFTRGTDVVQRDPLEKYLLDYFTTFWPDLPRDETLVSLRWITGKEEENLVASICSYSNSTREEGLFFINNAVGKTRESVEKYLATQNPSYLDNNQERADFIFSNAASSRPLAFPRIPNHLARVLKRVIESGEDVEQNENYTYNDLLHDWIIPELTELRKGTSPKTITECSVSGTANKIMKVVAYSGERVFRGPDVIDWSKIPKNWKNLCDEIKENTVSDTKRKIRKFSWELPDEWEGIVQEYFNEVKESLSD